MSPPTSRDRVDWATARVRAHAAGAGVARPARDVPLVAAEGRTLAADLRARTDLPSFPTSAVDGFAVRGAGPWRVLGSVLAGQVPPPLAGEGTTVEIATGAMVPAGATAVIRRERVRRTATGLVAAPTADQAALDGGRGDWRLAGEEARAGDVLLPAGAVVTPAVIGLAAAAGHDTLPVWVVPPARICVFGDELLVAGPATGAKLRDALGPALPGWLRRLGADPLPGQADAPLPDTADGQVETLAAALRDAVVVCTTGGTMDGPADHLRTALRALGASPVVDAVAVRPGGPMTLARCDTAAGPRFVVGLPGNPLAAVAALVTLVGPLLAGLRGQQLPELPAAVLDVARDGRPGLDRLVPVQIEPGTGRAVPLEYHGAAMLRGLAVADGFAVVPPAGAAAGATVRLAPLPVSPAEIHRGRRDTP